MEYYTSSQEELMSFIEEDMEGKQQQDARALVRSISNYLRRWRGEEGSDEFAALLFGSLVNEWGVEDKAPTLPVSDLLQVLRRSEVVTSLDVATFVVRSFQFLQRSDEFAALVKKYTSRKIFTDSNTYMRLLSAETTPEGRAELRRRQHPEVLRFVQDFSDMMNSPWLPRLPVSESALVLYRYMHVPLQSDLLDADEVPASGYTSTALGRPGTYKPPDASEGDLLLMVIMVDQRSPAARGLYLSFQTVGWLGENEVLLPPGLFFRRRTGLQEHVCEEVLENLSSVLDLEPEELQPLCAEGDVDVENRTTIASYSVDWSDFAAVHEFMLEADSRKVRESSAYQQVRGRLLYRSRLAMEAALLKEDAKKPKDQRVFVKQGERVFARLGKAQLQPKNVALQELAVDLRDDKCWPHVLRRGRWVPAKHLSEEALAYAQKMGSFYAGCDALQRRLRGRKPAPAAVPLPTALQRTVAPGVRKLLHNGVEYALQERDVASAASEVMAADLLALFGVARRAKLLVRDADRVFVGTGPLPSTCNRLGCEWLRERPSLFRRYLRSLVLDVWLGMRNACGEQEQKQQLCVTDEGDVVRDTAGAMFSRAFAAVPTPVAAFDELTERDWAAGRKLLQAVPKKKVVAVVRRYAPAIRLFAEPGKVSRVDPLAVVLARRQYLLAHSAGMACQRLVGLHELPVCLTRVQGLAPSSASPTATWVVSLAPGSLIGRMFHPQVFLKMWSPRLVKRDRSAALMLENAVWRRVSRTNSRLFLPLLASFTGRVADLRRMVLRDARYRGLTSSFVDDAIMQQLREAAQRNANRETLDAALRRDADNFDFSDLDNPEEKQVVETEDVKISRQVAVMVSPYVPHGDHAGKYVRRVLQRRKHTALWSLVLQVAAACSQLSVIGVMHGDLHLKNVMVKLPLQQRVRLSVGSTQATFVPDVWVQVFDFDKARTTDVPNPVMESRGNYSEDARAYIANKDVHTFLANLREIVRPLNPEYAQLLLLAASGGAGVGAVKRLYDKFEKGVFPPFARATRPDFERCATAPQVFANVVDIMRSSLKLLRARSQLVQQDEFVRLPPPDGSRPIPLPPGWSVCA